MSLTSRIQALIDYANETTGVEDTTLGYAVKTLCDGYKGAGVPTTVLPSSGVLSSQLAALLAYANEVTGKGDTTMGDAIRTLCEGYGKEHWDYDWDWRRDKIVPPGMTYKSKTERDEYLALDWPNLDFGHVGDCEMEIEVDSTYGVDSQPQFIIKTGNRQGGKIWKTSGANNYTTNVSGTNVSGLSTSNTMRTIRLKSEGSVLSLYIDRQLMASGKGVSNNAYIYYTGIYYDHLVSQGARFRSIKFRKL